MLYFIIYALFGVLVTILILSYKKTVLLRDGQPYLIRRTLFSCHRLSIKLHYVIKDDIGEMHNHPWNYISIILWGGYKEQTYVSIGSGCTICTHTKTTIYKPLSVLIRKADRPHKLLLLKGKPCLSLIFTGRKVRKWDYVPSKSTKEITMNNLEAGLTDEDIAKITSHYWI
jgi:hypothetical protein